VRFCKSDYVSHQKRMWHRDSLAEATNAPPCWSQRSACNFAVTGQGGESRQHRQKVLVVSTGLHACVSSYSMAVQNSKLTSPDVPGADMTLGAF
jgi:hypothetical protein